MDRKPDFQGKIRQYQPDTGYVKWLMNDERKQNEKITVGADSIVPG